MKQFIAIVALAALVSCGGSATTETTKTDSTSVKCDSTKIKVDSTKKSDSIAPKKVKKSSQKDVI